MKKFFNSLVLTLVLINQTIAQGNIHSKLNDSFVDLTFNLSQVSDKDPEEKAKMMKQFEADLKGLIAEGLTQEELMKYVTSQIQDKELKAEFESITSASNFEKLGTDKTLKLAVQALKEGQKEGSNWIGNGETLLYGLLIVLVVVAVVFGDGVYVGCYDYDYYYDSCYYDDYYYDDYWYYY